MMACLYKVRLSVLAAAASFFPLYLIYINLLVQNILYRYGKTTKNLIILISFTILSVLQVYTS